MPITGSAPNECQGDLRWARYRENARRCPSTSPTRTPTPKRTTTFHISSAVAIALGSVSNPVQPFRPKRPLTTGSTRCKTDQTPGCDGCSARCWVPALYRGAIRTCSGSALRRGGRWRADHGSSPTFIFALRSLFAEAKKAAGVAIPGLGAGLLTVTATADERLLTAPADSSPLPEKTRSLPGLDGRLGLRAVGGSICTLAGVKTRSGEILGRQGILVLQRRSAWSGCTVHHAMPMSMRSKDTTWGLLSSLYWLASKFLDLQ